MTTAISATGTELQAAGASQPGLLLIVDTSRQSVFQLPAEIAIADAQYQRLDSDLVIANGAGDRIVLKGYFALGEPPDLIDAGGAHLSPALAYAFAVRSGDIHLAQAAGANDAGAIGAVQTVQGEATATHTNGSRDSLTQGAPVFQNDIIETGANSAVRINFLDDTSFALGDNGRMALSELIYDPSSESGSTVTGILKGVFVFTSGKIAQSNQENMIVNTPVAQIGIRGTIAAGDVQPVGETSRFTIILGAIEVRNAAGSVILDERNESTEVTGPNSPPSPPQVLTPQQILQLYQSVLPVAGDLLQSALDQTPPDGGSPGGSFGLDDDLLLQGMLDELGLDRLEFFDKFGGIADFATHDLGALRDLIGLYYGEQLLQSVDLPAVGPDPGPLSPDADGLADLPPLGPTPIDPSLLDETPPPPGPGPGPGTGTDGGQNIIGTPGNDRLTGGTQGDTIDGGAGDDTIAGGGGPDWLIGGDGSDWLFGDSGTDLIFGLGGNDLLFGGTGDDVLFGGAGDDVLFGGAGNDQVFGGSGGDFFVGGTGLGDDLYDGGGGIDVISFQSAQSDVFVDLQAGVATGGADIGSDQLVDIENVIGGGGSDSILGDNGVNFLQGGGGDDVLVGRGGNDDLRGETGNDRISGGEGDDFIDGGDGFDVAVYQGSIKDYNVVKSGSAFEITDLDGDDGNEGTDQLFNIEKIEFSDGSLAFVTINNAVAVEGSTLKFTVSLSASVDKDVQVFYKTTDGTAESGDEYFGETDSIIIAAGSRTGVITIDTPSDLFVQLGLNFNVILTGVTGPAILDDDSAKGTILDQTTAPANHIIPATYEDFLDYPLPFEPTPIYDAPLANDGYSSFGRSTTSHVIAATPDGP